jgi:hypothetical protein
MKNEALYNKTVDILVKAYFNDTLVHGKCNMCAVGNLCGGEYLWGRLFRTEHGVQYFGNAMLEYYGIKYDSNKMIEGLRQIDNTGYSLLELAKIEFAFESASGEGDWSFNGLMAVIEVLDQIHENTDTQITTSAKERFKKAVV